MSEQYVGNLKREMSKGGKEYFKGMFGKVPVVGFWGKKNPNQINLKLDVGLIKWIDEKEDDNQGQAPRQEAVNGNDASAPLPF